MYPLYAFRKLFPSVEYKTYLNHAGCSPYSIRVTEAMRNYIEECGGEVIENYSKNLEIRETLRHKLAELIRVPASDIALTKNTSSGLSLLASGLDWKTGDRILLFDLEFPSNIYPFMNCARWGAEIDFVPARQKRNGRVLTEDIESKITPKTRLLSISFVEFLNGWRNDLKTIGEICRQHQIIFCVDGIQGLGALPLDASDCGIHFLSSAAHKWLMGPQGIGFIYVHPELLERLVMTQVGWLSVKDAWNFFDYRLEWEDGAKRFEIGTENWPGVYGFLASVEQLLEYGIDSIARHILELTGDFLHQAERLGLEVLTPSEDPYRSGIVTFRLLQDPDNRKTARLFDFLSDHKIITSFREGYIRVSPHGYNTRDDMEKLITTIQDFNQRNG